MTEQQYDLFFKGQILEGFEASVVQQNLKQRLKLSDSYIANLFSGQEVRLKHQIDKPTAIKFQQAFKASGARLIVKLHAPEPTPEPSPTAKPVQQDTGKGSTFGVAEPDTDENADALVEHHQPDLKAPQGVPTWEVAAPGAELTKPKQEEEASASFDLDSLSLAEPGSQLSSPVFEPPEPFVPLANLSLADNEGDLPTEKQDITPITVDISHITLSKDE